MNKEDWRVSMESQIKQGVVDLIRKKISAEDYEKMRNQTYEEYRNELGQGYQGISEPREYEEKSARQRK